jgi:16S rRNA (cytidine1402-2'-O)-methyltransferase
MKGILYLVATPIGNLKDITLRALETLKAVDCIACEDTRVTGKLLRHYEIAKPLVSYHEHNERRRAPELLERLLAGKSVALVSDAGTPGVSDPGAHLVEEARALDIRCEPIPGPSAFSAILSVAGFVPEPVVFAGFPPSRSTQRRRWLEQFHSEGSVCMYEAPHRIVALLTDLSELWGDPQVLLGRELTKLYEEVLRGSASQLAGILRQRERVVGEIVLLAARPSVAVAREDTGHPLDLRARFEQLLAAGENRKSALRKLGRETGIPRSELYRKLLSGGASEL